MRAAGEAPSEGQNEIWQQEMPPFDSARHDSLYGTVPKRKRAKRLAPQSPDDILAAIRSQPWLYKPLQEASERLVDNATGRPSVHRGDWNMFVLTLIANGGGPVEKFWREKNRDLIDCDLATRRPDGSVEKADPSTANRRVHAVAKNREGIKTATRRIQRRVRQRQPDTGRVIAYDGALVSSAFRRYHVCEELGVPCEGFHPGSETKDTKALLSAKMHEDGLPEEDARDARRRNRVKSLSYDDLVGRGADPKAIKVNQAYVDSRGHIYRCADVDAATRKYQGKNGKPDVYVHGYLHLIATDLLTGGALANIVVPANYQEHLSLADIVRAVSDTCGLPPQIMGYDKGNATRGSVALLSDLGTSIVSPIRASRTKSDQAEDWANDTVDRHGVLQCRHCGGACATHGRGTGYKGNGDAVRVTATCQLRATEDCAKPQIFDPNDDELWRHGGSVVNRTHEVWHQVAAYTQNAERTHKQRREDSGVGGKDIDDIELLMAGRDVQQLKLDAAVLIDWVRIALDNDWLHEPPKDTTKNERRKQLRKLDATRQLTKVLAERAELELDLARGPRAEELGIAVTDDWFEPDDVTAP